LVILQVSLSRQPTALVLTNRTHNNQKLHSKQGHLKQNMICPLGNGKNSNSKLHLFQKVRRGTKTYKGSHGVISWLEHAMFSQYKLSKYGMFTFMHSKDTDGIPQNKSILGIKF